MSVFDVVDRIYKMNPCAAVRYRLKRIMGEEIEPELFDEFYNSKWVEILKANQNSDGGFGRFHSRDSKIKQVFPTTELAVDSIKMLDIPRGNELVDKLCDYMEKLLRNEIAWPDGYERNKWYRPAQPLFVASKLSVFGSDCREYLEIFNCWHTILKEAFADGEYSIDRTDITASKLLGCDIDGSYIGLNSIYTVELFANMQDRISEELKRNYLGWLHSSGRAIGYTSVVLSKGLNNNISELYRVYSILSRFSCFRKEFEEEFNQLEKLRDRDGFWNFGRDFKCRKLSDDWRTRERMMVDQTVMWLGIYRHVDSD